MFSKGILSALAWVMLASATLSAERVPFHQDNREGWNRELYVCSKKPFSGEGMSGFTVVLSMHKDGKPFNTIKKLSPANPWQEPKPEMIH